LRAVPRYHCATPDSTVKMPIQKQEFYEGAALHLLARSGRIQGLTYKHPFFVINDNLLALLKYSTKIQSPWAFTFTPEEQRFLAESTNLQTIVGLICGSDGIVALRVAEYSQIASVRTSSIHLACYRKHGEHYEIGGPDGIMRKKVAPSSWQRILG
jgi:hypothetical protein